LLRRGHLQCLAVFGRVFDGKAFHHALQIESNVLLLVEQNLLCAIKRFHATYKNHVVDHVQRARRQIIEALNVSLVAVCMLMAVAVTVAMAVGLALAHRVVNGFATFVVVHQVPLFAPFDARTVRRTVFGALIDDIDLELVIGAQHVGIVIDLVVVNDPPQTRLEFGMTARRRRAR